MVARSSECFGISFVPSNKQSKSFAGVGCVDLLLLSSPLSLCVARTWRRRRKKKKAVVAQAAPFNAH